MRQAWLPPVWGAQEGLKWGGGATEVRHVWLLGGAVWMRWSVLG